MRAKLAHSFAAIAANNLGLLKAVDSNYFDSTAVSFEKDSEVPAPYYTLPFCEPAIDGVEMAYVIDVEASKKSFKEHSKAFEEAITEFLYDAYERHAEDYYSSLGCEIFECLSNPDVVKSLWQESIVYKKVPKEQPQVFCMHNPSSDTLNQPSKDVIL